VFQHQLKHQRHELATSAACCMLTLPLAMAVAVTSFDFTTSAWPGKSSRLSSEIPAVTMTECVQTISKSQRSSCFT